MIFNLFDTYDRKIFNRLRHISPPEPIVKFLKLYTRLGDGYVWIAVIAYLAISYSWDFWQVALWKSLVATAISLSFYLLVKYSTKRPRPFQKWTDTQAEVPPLDKWSFPSGHIMNNLAIGCAIATSFPELWIFVTVFPLSCGLLRIYFGVHYASDVFFGGLFGIMAAIGSLLFWP